MRKIILTLLFTLTITPCLADESTSSSDIQSLNNALTNCQQEFIKQEQICPEKWSMKCYDFLMELNHNTQNCYIEVAQKIFSKYYNQDNETTQKKLQKFVSYTYEQYLFLYNDNIFCTKNNCGLSPYLYSEYTTTQMLENYLKKALNAVEFRQ
jgi:hypothetical protein